MLNKKEFIRNRPFDEVDGMDMQDFIEDSIKETVKLITGFGVIEGLNVIADSDLNIKIAPGIGYDNSGNMLEVIQNEIVDLGTASSQSKIAVITIKKNIVSVDNVDIANKYDLGNNFIYSRDLLVSYEPKVYVGSPGVAPIRPQVPSDDIELAEITIRANATSISAGDIRDRRLFVKKYYLDILDGPTSARPSNPKISQFYFDTTLNKMIVYNGNSWDVIETTAGAGGNLAAHTSRTDNPHSVSKSQVGLSNVDNIQQATKTEFNAHNNDNVRHITAAERTSWNNHNNSTSNPHSVTKAQVGLGNVDNIQQATKAEFNTHNTDNTRHITAAERTSWNSRETTTGSQAKVNAHADLTNNPHGVSKSQVGLSNVDNIQQATKVEFNTHNADNIRHITAQERTTWNNKETPAGALQKADQAYDDALVYVNNKVSDLTQLINSKTNFNDGIIIGNYMISVNQSNGNLEITVVT